MKYICLGYYDKGKFDGLTEAETTHALNTTTIFALTGTGLAERRSSPRKPL